jgi:hypothetical protein
MEVVIFAAPFTHQRVNTTGRTPATPSSQASIRPFESVPGEPRGGASVRFHC